MKKIRKLAIIRDNENSPCPFGLPITVACHSVGNAVDKMQVLNFDAPDSQIKLENQKIWQDNIENKKCKYAAHLFKNKTKVVDCDFGDTAAGLSQDGIFTALPYYNDLFEGLGMSGLLTYPPAGDGDMPQIRNLYYGMQGWAHKRHFKSILRQGLLKALHSIKS